MRRRPASWGYDDTENVTVAGTRAVSEERLAAGGGMCVLDGPVTIIRASVSNTSVVASGINGKAYGGAVYSHMHSSFALIADPKDGWTAIKQSWIVNASAMASRARTWPVEECTCERRRSSV